VPTSQELKKLFGCCIDIRQKLIMTALFDTGMRVRELPRVRLSDFDKQHQSITIRISKGQRTRIVYYGNRLRLVLKQYCKYLGYLPQGFLIESYKDPNKALTLRGVQFIVKQTVKRSGLKKRIHPHTLRPSFAVHYLNCGGSIFVLQRLLGHQNITTTLHYLKYTSLSEGKKMSVLDEMP
jgi:integrase/recombinase XerD